MTGRRGGKRIVLVGAGHAHLYTLKRTAEVVAREHELILIAPGAFWYSGLATGVLSGYYPPELDRVDVGAMVRSGGGVMIEDRVGFVDPDARCLELESGDSLSYDVLSLNVGSRVDEDRIPGIRDHGTPVKPVQGLFTLKEEIERAFAERERLERPLRLLVVGGGPSGCEVAANFAALFGIPRGHLEITLLTAGPRVLESSPRGASSRMARQLVGKGVQVMTDVPLEWVEAGRAIARGGRSFEFDFLVNATGLVPSPLIRESGLSVDESGALLVDRSLRSVMNERVFGGGDCIALESHPLPKVGVYAIRESPILFHNLLAAAEGGALRHFKPQERFLLIFNLGAGEGLATWGRWYGGGRWAFRLKDWIDRRFLRLYQEAP